MKQRPNALQKLQTENVTKSVNNGKVQQTLCFSLFDWKQYLKFKNILELASNPLTPLSIRKTSVRSYLNDAPFRQNITTAENSMGKSNTYSAKMLLPFPFPSLRCYLASNFVSTLS